MTSRWKVLCDLRKTQFSFFFKIEVTRPDGSPVPNTIVTVSSTTYPKDQEISTTYTSDKDGFVIFKRTIGADKNRIIINVRFVYELWETLIVLSVVEDVTVSFVFLGEGKGRVWWRNHFVPAGV